MERYLGMDIGGTSAKYGIVDAKGNIDSLNCFPTNAIRNEGELVDKVCAIVETAMGKGIAGVGICSLGVINSSTGEVLGGVDNMPVLAQLNLKRLITERYGIKTNVMNDAFAAARGEMWLGAGRGYRNFFCITLGTGFGGCAVIDGKIHEGSHFRAGEVGFFDYCGENSYLEKRVSTKAVMDYTSSVLGERPFDGVQFFRRIKEGDPRYLRIFDRWMDELARVISNIILLLDPEKIIIGGGVSDQRDILIPALTRNVNKKLPGEFAGQAEIDTAKCPNTAGILGAVSYFIF